MPKFLIKYCDPTNGEPCEAVHNFDKTTSKSAAQWAVDYAYSMLADKGWFELKNLDTGERYNRRGDKINP